MQLLISIIRFEQQWGGAPESVRLLARALRPIGIRCDVVTNRGFRRDVSKFDFLPAPGSETDHLPDTLIHDYDAFLIAGPWQPWFRLRRILARLSPGAAVLYLPRGGLAVAEFQRARDLKKFPYFALIERQLIKRSDYVVFSSRIEDEYTRLAGPLHGKRVVIPDLVETVPFASEEYVPDVAAPFTATFLAEAAPRKGLAQMLEGLGKAIHRGTVPANMILNVGGSVRPGSERYMAHCRALAATLPIETRFIGSVAHDARAALYAATDLFLTPSKFESFGLTVIEALSAGCRLLSAPNLGALEFLPQTRTVTVAASATSDDLASALGAALAARPGKVDAAERAATRAMCAAAVDSINEAARMRWSKLLAASAAG